MVVDRIQVGFTAEEWTDVVADRVRFEQEWAVSMSDAAWVRCLALRGARAVARDLDALGKVGRRG